MALIFQILYFFKTKLNLFVKYFKKQFLQFVFTYHHIDSIANKTEIFQTKQSNVFKNDS
jgi:hypothetical protein